MKKTRGVVSLVFDDGYTSVFNNVVPLLNERHLPGVFAIPLDTHLLHSNEQRPVTSVEQWLDIQQAGHEIAAHSITHRNLTLLDDVTLRHELAYPAEVLHATTLIYPGGAHDERVVQVAREHYTAARTVQKGFIKRPTHDAWQLPTYDFTRHNFSAKRANLLALWAFLTDRWLIETYHIVDDNETAYTHAVPLTAFRQHLDFLQRLPLRVATIRDVITPS